MKTQRKDSDIKKDILDELKWSPQVFETEIGVIVNDGAVTLMGTVPRYNDKEGAKNAAKRIKGVRAIADEIEVKLPIGCCQTNTNYSPKVSTDKASLHKYPARHLMNSGVIS